MPRAALLALIVTAAPVLAQAELTVDQSQSTISGSISALGLSDSDSSPVAGFFSIELDSYTTPSQLWLWDFELHVVNTLNFTLNAGFFGRLDITLTGLGVCLAGDGPIGPAAVDGAGVFELPDVPANLEGTGNYSGTGLFGAVGSGTFNLADFSPTTATVAGVVSTDGQTITLTGMVSNTITQDISGVQVTVSVDGDVVATGPVPPCLADLTGEGDVNTNDFFLFLSYYQAQDPRADFAPGGGINTNDFFAFLAAYQQGC